MAREADQEATAVDMVVPKVVDTEVVSAAQVAVEAEVVVVSAAADVAAEVVAVVAIIHTKNTFTSKFIRNNVSHLKCPPLSSLCSCQSFYFFVFAFFAKHPTTNYSHLYMRSTCKLG